MAVLSTSRRALLGAIAAAPLIAVPTFATPSPTANLAALIERHRKLEADYSVWMRTIYDVASDRFSQAAQAIPHRMTESSFTNAHGDRIHLSTESAQSVSQARHFVNGKLFQHVQDMEFGETQRELAALADWRDQELARIAEFFLGGPDTEYDRRNDEISGVIHAIISAPARSIADLAAKIEFARSHGQWESDDFADALANDMRGLACGNASC